MPPSNPVAAATHPDPYPFYADLVTRRPLYRDDALGLWVASSARAVGAVLSSPACRVRPPSEPVPRGLQGLASAEVFRRLARMNDGPFHLAVRRALVGLLRTFGAGQDVEQGRRQARRLLEEEVSLRELAFRLPVQAVGALLGLDPGSLPEVAAWTGSLVRGMAPGADAEQVRAGALAAERLMAVFRSRLTGPARGVADGPLALLAREVAASPGIGAPLPRGAARSKRSASAARVRDGADVARGSVAPGVQDGEVSVPGASAAESVRGGIAPGVVDGEVSVPGAPDEDCAREVVAPDALGGDVSLSSPPEAECVEVVAANALGLLVQAHDATAGLLGNALRVLMADTGAHAEVLSRPSLLPRLLEEVLRYDPPVQNTRRFLAEDALIDGQAMAAGDGVLVLLAAANRDPAVHREPHRFDLHREPADTATFGQGLHACPGATLARSISLGALEVLLGTDLASHRAAFADVAFLPSVNGRVPLLPHLPLQLREETT
ncbi:cytochrome P450 [Myxococcus stipitatus]|uniref:cytochrome P450 n=1 Tax=Myxococcus stipitatus TaxID=83455 RepID=UPI001F349B93|nr:cytochrome P450 [Myxococcus stipitatus]MCE9673203.1 cytochrome P450 [Myxococcus stipitatus]